MKTYNLYAFFIIALGFLVTTSCSKEDQFEVDQQRIEDFLNEHQIDADSTSSGLYYVIDDPGTPEKPNINSTVTVNYVGFLMDGTVFDAGNNVTFPLTSVIAGWQEGLQLYGRGGRGLLIIPSHLAYGDRVVSGIPANSVLVFEIHLIDFE